MSYIINKNFFLNVSLRATEGSAAITVLKTDCFVAKLLAKTSTYYSIVGFVDIC